MAKPDTTWKHDRAIFLAERPNPANLRIFRPDIASLHLAYLESIMPALHPYYDAPDQEPT